LITSWLLLNLHRITAPAANACGFLLASKSKTPHFSTAPFLSILREASPILASGNPEVIVNGRGRYDAAGERDFVALFDFWKMGGWWFARVETLASLRFEILRAPLKPDY
jgi:hypothetical protein